MKKRLLSMLLVVVMVISLFPVSAGAAGTHTHDSVTFTKEIQSVDDLKDLMEKGGNGVLMENILNDQVLYTVASSKTVSLCLNGHVLKTSGIDIETSGKFTLYDCNTKTKHYFSEDTTTGRWEWNDNLTGDAIKHTVAGGVITGAYRSKGGGAIITRGESSKFVLNGGNICGNGSPSVGGGVWLYGKYSSFTMNGGMIAGNYAGSGGGVYNEESRDFTMTGGLISDNVSNDSRTSSGGGVCNLGNFTMTGGEISGNTATSTGCSGLAANSGNIYLGGTAKILSNYDKNGNPCDVSINSTKTPTLSISANVEPAQGMSVGLCSGITVKNAKAGQEKFFFSSDPTKIVRINNNGTPNNLTDDYLEVTAGYDITNERKEADKAANHGYLAINKETAVAGNTVTITVNPDENYRLKEGSLKATYNGSTELELTGEGNTYTFKMPAYAVTVSAEFEELAAQIGTTKYVTLAEAVAAANTGETIELLSDVELDAALVLNKSITLDLKQKKLTTAKELYADGEGVEVTVKNGKIDGVLENGNAVWAALGQFAKSKLNVEDVEFVGTLEQALLNFGAEMNLTNIKAAGNVVSDTGSVTVSGGELTYLEIKKGTAAISGTEDKPLTVGEISAPSGVVTKSGKVTATTIPAGFGWDANGKLINAEAEISGVAYATLAQAVAAAQSGDTVKLLQNITLSAEQDIASKLTLDLCGFTIKAGEGFENNKSAVIGVKHGGDLTVTDSSDPSTGKIDANGNTYAAVIMAPAGDTDDTNTAKFTLESGSLYGQYFGITGNGNDGRGNTEITIAGGAVYGNADATHTDNLGIYNPQQNSKVTVTGGEISGYSSGIEMRSGALDVTGGKITATAEAYSCNPNGGGNTTVGAAVAIAQHTTKKDISVNISGGTFTGANALSESNPQANDPAPQVTMNITGGTFDGEVTLTDVQKCVKGGTFKKGLNEAYLYSDQYVDYVIDAGTGVVSKAGDVAQIGSNKYTSLAKALADAKAGDKITLLDNISTSKQIVIDKAITLDGKGKTITRTPGGADATQKAGILVTAGATLMELTVSGPNTTADGWDSGEFGIKFYNANGALLNNVTVTGANAGIQVNGGRVDLTGTITLTGNEFGGIELCKGGALDISTATLVNAGETDANPVLWNDDTKGTITFNEAQALYIRAADANKDHYYLDGGAKIGTAYYRSLTDAVAAAKDGDTVTLLKSHSGAGIFVAPNKFAGSGLTIDFKSYTYTCTGPAVGSTGTKSQAFHIEEGNKVTLKDGTVTSTADSGVKMLVQNYCDLTLNGMTLNGANLPDSGRYVLSNNCGNTVIENTTITAKDGDFAFDTCKYGSYDMPSVEVKGTSTITGDVELSGGNLTLTAGTLTGSLVATNVGDGIVTKASGFTATAPTGYEWVDNEGGTEAALKFTVTINATAEDFTYGDGKTGYKELSVSDSLVAADDLVKTYYKETTAGAYETTGTTTVPTNAGNYKVVISVADSNTKYTGSKTLTFTISKYNTTLTNVSTKLDYKTGEKQSITFTPTSPEGAADALSQSDFTVKYYKVDEDYGNVTNATSLTKISSIGRYIYVVTLNSGHDNYQFDPSTTFTETVTTSTTEEAVAGKVNAGIVAIGVDVPKQQKPISFASGLLNKLTTDTTVTNALTNENSGATTTYTSSNTAVATVATDGTVTIKGAGSTTITAQSHVDGMTDVYAAYTLNVSKKEITVTVNDQTIKYGAASPYDAVADLTFSETIDTTGITPTFSTSYVVGKSVNEYAVRVTLPASDKYSYVYVSGTLTVEPKELTANDFTVTAANKAYDGTTDASVTAAVKAASLVSTDTLTVTAVGSFANANVGTGKTVNYEITGIYGAKANNYTVGTVKGTATANITNAAVSFAFGENEFTYDGNKKAVSVTASGGNCTSVKYKGTGSTTYAESTEAPTHAGTYTVTAEYDATSYTLSGSNTTTLTINPANVTVWTTGGTTHLFGDADKSVSVMSIPNLALDVTYYSVGTDDKVGSSTTPSAVGKYLYVITLTNNDKNKDYKIGDALSGTFTGKALNELVGSNFGVMTIGNSAQKALSFADAQVSKLTTDSAFTNTLTNPNNGATVTYTSSNANVATVNATTGAVTIVGVGNATITAKSVLTGYTDAYASYTLNVAKQQIAVTVNNQSVTYGDASPYDALADLTFTPSISTDGLGTPAFTTTYQVGSSIGEYNVRASGLTSDKYSFVYEPGTLTVNPKTLNVENFTVTAANKVYDGNTSATVTAVTKDGLVSSDTLTVTATGSFADADVADGKTVSYTITGISGVKAANYVLGTTTGTTTANITKAQITFSFGTSEFAYDGNKKTVAVSAVDEDNRVFTDYAVEYYNGSNKLDEAPANVGTYTVKAVFDTDKYECSNDYVMLTITRGDAVVWASAGTEHLFNDANKTITAMSAPNLDLTVTYYTVGEDDIVGEAVEPGALGRYLYVITLANNDTNKNYTIGGALEGPPTDKKVDELTASNIGIMTIDNSVQPELGTEQRVVTKTYGDAPFTVKVTGGEEDATITYSIPNETDREIASVDQNSGEITILKPGSIVVKATASKTGYTDAVTYFTVIIEKRLVNISLGDEIVYAGKTITAPFTVTNDVEGNRIEAKDIQFFYQSRIDETNHDFRNVDAYFVTAEIPSGNEYYHTNGAVSQLINITKAPLTVTAENKTVTYGDVAPTYTVSYEPLGEDTSLGGSAKFVCDYKQYGNAGNYDIGVYGLYSPNYDITFVKGTLTVEPKPVTLNWSNDSFTYDGEEHSVTATVTNAVNRDRVNVTTYTGNKGTDVGSYNAEATALNDSNYTLTGGTNLSTGWQIAPKPVTVKPADIWFFANSSTPELTLDLSALPEADRSYSGTPEFKITNESGTEFTLEDAIQTAGVYTITWTNPEDVDFGVNYAVTATTGTLTVNKYSGGCKAEVSLKENGEYGLKLGGQEIGEFTFTKSGSGWTIKNADGKYLGFANKALTYTTSPFEWKYTGGRFQTSVTTTSGGSSGWNWIWNWGGSSRTTTTTYYLAYVDGKLTVSTATTGADATFVKWNATAEHSFGDWTMDKDTEQHYRVCSFCGERDYADCHYGDDHKCICGRIDPSLVYVTATFVTGDGASTAPAAQKVIKDEGKITKPENDPTKIGYIFGGWYVGDSAFTFNTTISSDTTITAKWTQCDAHDYDENDICTKCGLHDPTKVPQCITTKTTALKEGDLIFTLGGHTFDEEYTFTKSGNGWTIKNAEGKYLALSNNTLTDADTPFVWTFSNNRFSATGTSSSNSGWGWGWGGSRTTTTTYYLVYTGGKLTVSTSTNSATASFAEKQESLNHTFGEVWTTDKNSEQHYRVCSVCGEKEYANCKYDQPEHKCICGRIDPHLVYVTATFITGEGASTAPKAQTVIQNEGLIVKPENDPAKIGFIFDGWYADETEFIFDTKISENVTIKAKWTKCNEHDYDEETHICSKCGLKDPEAVAHCSGDKTVSLTAGKLLFTLGGKDLGEFTFAKSGNNWTIQNAEGKYLGFANNALSVSENAFGWTFSNNRFQTSVTTTSGSNGGWGWFFGGSRTTTTTYYLVYTNDNIAVSTGTSGANASFKLHVESDEHSGAWKTVGKTHTRKCEVCGETETENCTYGANHRCTVCGGYDPDYVKIDVSVSKSQRTSGGNSGWGWGWNWGGSSRTTTYTATITAKATGATVSKVEYSTNGSTNWTTGNTVTSNSQIGAFLIRVTDSNGTVHNFKYDGSTVTEN